jgi:hypothetical protein
MVGGRGVGITPQTHIDESQGPAVVGANAQVDGFELPDGSVVALMISVQASTVETDFFVDVIQQMGGSQWLIGNRWVVVTGSTQIVGAPAVGKVARVSLERRPGGDWMATRIEVEESPEPVYFEGIISAIGSGFWVVGGRTVVVDASTSITGAPPQVGLYAEVEAIDRDGSLVAISINVVAATPPPPPTATPTPQPPTSTPTAPPTLEPTPTPTASAEPTQTVGPPPTATPEPPPATPTPTTGPPIPPPIGSPTPAPPTATPAPSPTLVIPFPTPTFPFPTPTAAP